MLELGSSIRKLRKQRNLTLEELAAKTDLSAGFISKIERGINSPSFNNLQKICYALNVTTTDLVTKQYVSEATDCVIRKKDRKLIYDYSNVVRFESLFSNPPYFSVNVMTIRGLNNEYTSTRHPYDEFGIIAQGSLSVKMNGQEYMLNEGDCIFIKSQVPHHVQKCSDCDCISYWIMTSEYGDTR